MKFLTMKYSIADIIDYFRGNYRYWAWYHAKFLIRDFIQEQIRLRIKLMDRECYQSGTCKLCGCKTLALQMANKCCEKPCYPSMMTKKEWNIFLGKSAFASNTFYFTHGWIGTYHDLKSMTLWINSNDEDEPLKYEYSITQYRKTYDIH